MKTHYEFARELHLTFASVGGGLHLGILIFKIYELFSDTTLFETPVGSAVISLQLAITGLVWCRLYWVYLNTIVFFAPFDHPKIFVLDVMAFFFGGLALSFIGFSIPWILICALVLFICYKRIQYTVMRAIRFKEIYPQSFERLQQTLPKLATIMIIPMAIGSIFGISLIWLHKIWLYWDVIFYSIFAMVCAAVFLRHFDPSYPVERGDAYSENQITT